MVKHLKKGDRIRIGGLGILQVRKRAARMGRNSRVTGEPIKIKASKKVAPSGPPRELKEAGLIYFRGRWQLGCPDESPGQPKHFGRRRSIRVGVGKIASARKSDWRNDLARFCPPYGRFSRTPRRSSRGITSSQKYGSSSR